MKRFPTTEAILLLLILILCLVSGCKVPQKTETSIQPEPIHDTIYFIDAHQFEIQGDTVFEIKPCPPVPECPPATTINAKKVKNKIKDSYNYIGEINDLKKSVQVKDSQIDSLTIVAGKKSNGTQTNTGIKPHWLILCGLIFLIIGFIIGKVTK